MKYALVALTFITGLLFSAPTSALAQQQPCQWNYANIGGVATATYCGNVKINGVFQSLPLISPQSEGAKCDGSSLDTTIIQSLVTGAAGNKYIVWFPSNPTACVSGSLTVAANTNILFDGGTLLRNPSAADSGGMFTITGSNVTIEGTGIINGNSTNGSYGNCIKADGAYTGIVIGGPGFNLSIALFLE